MWCRAASSLLTSSCEATAVFKERSQIALRGDGTHGSFQGGPPGLHRRLSARDRDLRVDLQRGGQAVCIHEGGEASPGPGRWAGVAFGEGGLRAGQALPEKELYIGIKLFSINLFTSI